MAEKKRINPFLWVIVAVVVVLFIVLLVNSRGDRYQAVGTLPTYDPNSQPQDGPASAPSARESQQGRATGAGYSVD